ncbi:DinB family protein [Streptomyces sp. NPDC002577]
MDSTDFHWADQLVDQLEFYWNFHFLPRLADLSDEEYFWEPVDGCWTLRRNEEGRYVLDDGEPPEPPPVTTIAWRLVHIGGYCLANRASAFFGAGGGPDDADMFDPRHVPADLPGSAAEALKFLEESFRRWRDGVACLDEEALRTPLGPKGGPYAESPMAGLILHINREIMHHGGEVCLLRDLYRATGATGRGARLAALTR